MGKAQSKRSVDITTETKKGPEGGEEVTGKLEKIEDIDQKQVNGDATPQEKSDAAGGGEKKDAPDETENDKDLTTEKSAAEAAAATPSPTTNNEGSGDKTADETSPKEDAATAATPVKEGEEISPLAEKGSNKKSKAEKLKKKWSFRSISFGKKDKSKPKSESTENAPAAAVENAVAATNGEAAETSQPAAEGAVADAPKTKDAAGATTAETKPVEAEKIENGVATEAEQKQMNGQKTPTSTDEAAEQKKPLETKETAVAATTAVTSPPPPAAAAVSNDTAANEKVESIVSNGTIDAEKNGMAHDGEHAEEKTTAAPVAVAAGESNSKSIPVDDEKPHQNGTNGDEAVEEITAATKTLQIEVKIAHPNDSNNSTITSTTTITTNSYTTTTINTNTIPADNINTEQKTTKTTDDDHNNIHISPAHTTDTINTSEMPTITTTTTTTTHSSNKSIDKCEEQSQPCKVILNISNEASPSPTVVEVEDELTSKPNVPEDHEVNKDEEDQQQQQQLAPPPLPVTAPPSQVIIFALKDENETNPSIEDEVMPTIEVIEAEVEPTPPAMEVIESLIETTATTITTNNGEGENLISMKKSVEAELVDEDDANVQFSGEIIDLGEVGMMSPQELALIAEQYTANVEDFEAQALNIVDEIERELEKEEASDDEEQQQQQLQQRSTEIQDITELINVQPIDMDLCSQSSEDNPIPPAIDETPEILLPPPPPLLQPEQHIEDPKIENILNEDEKFIIETLNDCIAKSNEILVESKHHNNHNYNNETDQLEATSLTIENNIENHNEDDVEISFDLRKKIDKLSLINEQEQEELEQHFEFGIKNVKHNVKEAIAAADGADANVDEIIEHNQHSVDENCIAGDFDDKELPTAKELKENAAAAEIKTQDLPVTCE